MTDSDEPVFRSESSARGCGPLLAFLIVSFLVVIAMLVAVGVPQMKKEDQLPVGLWSAFMLAMGVPGTIYLIWAWARGYCKRVELRGGELSWTSTTPESTTTVSCDDIALIDVHTGDTDSIKIVMRDKSESWLPLGGDIERFCKLIRAHHPNIHIRYDYRIACRVCGAMPRYVVYVDAQATLAASDDERATLYEKAGSFCKKHAPAPSDGLHCVALY